MIQLLQKHWSDERGMGIGDPAQELVRGVDVEPILNDRVRKAVTIVGDEHIHRFVEGCGEHVTIIWIR